MKKRMFIGLAAIALIGAVVLVFASMRRGSQMPSYKGKTAREWLRDVNTSNSTNWNMALDAFSTMGTNALPFLVNTLRKTDSPADKLYRGIYPKFPTLCQRHLLKPMTEQERWRAAAFILMNKHYVLQAFPGLLEGLKDKNNRAHFWILASLVNSVGPQDTNWVPTLIQCLTETNSGTRAVAAGRLGQIGPNAKAAIPNLTTSLQDPDASVRVDVAWALWQIGRLKNGMAELKRAAMAATPGLFDNDRGALLTLSEMNCTDPDLIPAFARFINTADQTLSMCSIQALANYGPIAKQAVPELIKRYHFGNGTDRQMILNTLEKIDPKALEELKHE